MKMPDNNTFQFFKLHFTSKPCENSPFLLISFLTYIEWNNLVLEF